jgi:hypothetical protein
MPPSRSAWGRIQKEAWLPTESFEVELRKHVGTDIDMGIGPHGRNARVTLDRVVAGSVTYADRSGNTVTLPISDVSGFSTSTEWWRHRR